MALDRKRLLVPAGYAALGIFSFVYFLFLGFPFDRLLSQKSIATSIDRMERENGVKLDVGSIRGGWLFDVVATDLRVTPMSPIRRAAAAAAGQEDDPTLRVEKISLRPALLPLLGGRLGVHLDAQVYGGHVRGTIGVGRSTTAVDLSVKNVELAKYSPLANKFQLNVGGQVGGKVDLVIDGADGAKSRGSIDLSIRNAMINESNPYGIQKIPQVSFDKGAGALIELKDGKATFQDVGLHGEDLDVTLEGDIELKKMLAYSSWDGHASIKASDSFKSQVSLLDSFLGPGRGSDGAYHYRLMGTLNRAPRPVPERK